MTLSELPPDPFGENPLQKIDEAVFELLSEGEVEYFDLFPNLNYEDVIGYAQTYTAAAIDSHAGGAVVSEVDLAGLLVHGIMIGALSQQEDLPGPTV